MGRTEGERMEFDLSAAIGHLVLLAIAYLNYRKSEKVEKKLNGHMKEEEG